MQAVFEFATVDAQLTEQHGPVDATVGTERSGLNSLELTDKAPFVVIARAKCLWAPICPQRVPRSVPVLKSAFGILLEHPLPVAVDDPFERGVIRASRNRHARRQDEA